MDDGDMDTWEVENYSLLTVVPSDGYLAVYAEPLPSYPGKFCLETQKLDAIGVASVVRKTMGRPKAALIGRVIRSEPPVGEIVGLFLKNGYWHICEEDDNYAGMCKVGDDYREAVGNLKTKYLRNLVDKDVAPGRKHKTKSLANVDGTGGVG